MSTTPTIVGWFRLHVPRVDAVTFVVVYKNPRDFPGKFVVRRWDVLPGAEDAIPDMVCTAVDTIDAARALVPSRMQNLGRVSIDDPAILEVWA